MQRTATLHSCSALAPRHVHCRTAHACMHANLQNLQNLQTRTAHHKNLDRPKVISLNSSIECAMTEFENSIIEFRVASKAAAIGALPNQSPSRCGRQLSGDEFAQSPAQSAKSRSAKCKVCSFESFSADWHLGGACAAFIRACTISRAKSRRRVKNRTSFCVAAEPASGASVCFHLTLTRMAADFGAAAPLAVCFCEQSFLCSFLGSCVRLRLSPAPLCGLAALNTCGQVSSRHPTSRSLYRCKNSPHGCKICLRACSAAARLSWDAQNGGELAVHCLLQGTQRHWHELPIACLHLGAASCDSHISCRS
jgi:hypothetical protein